MSSKIVAGQSVLGDLRQSGSLKALFPRPRSGALDAVVVNTAGGITGGDSFRLVAEAAPGTRLTLTTQAAERAYRAQPGLTGRIRNCLRVGVGARTNWLPQETILFQGASLDRSLTAEIDGDGALLLVETLVFGRAAMGETLTDASLFDRVTVLRDDKVVFRDSTRLDGDIAAHLARPAVASGARATALVVLVAPDAERFLPPVRRLLPTTAGASLTAADLLVARIVAPDSHLLRQSLIPVIECLSGQPIPRPWTI